MGPSPADAGTPPADASGRAPRVSVVVPVRDRRPLLRTLLQALTSQTYSDFEVVVVDDGSSDGSGDEADAARGHGLRVRVVRTAGVGAVAARRAGVAVAAGEVLAFTDSDCVPDAGWLAAGIREVDAGADVVHGPTVAAGVAGPLEHTVSSGENDGLYPTSNVFYRRWAYEAAGGFGRTSGLGFRPDRRARRLGFGEDTLLGWRVRRAGRAAYAADARVVHAVLPVSLREAVSRAWMTGAFPGLVREVPELRSTLLRGGVLLGSPTRLFAAASVALPLAGRWRVAALAFLVWLATGGRGAAASTPTKRWVTTVPTQLALDAVAEVALLAGSARARRLVV